MADKSNKQNSSAREYTHLSSELSSYWDAPLNLRRSDSRTSAASGGDDASRSQSPAVGSSSKPRKKEARPKGLGRQASHRRDYSRESIDAFSSATSNPPTPLEATSFAAAATPAAAPTPPPPPPVTTTTRMSSQRNRNSRGPNRSSGQSGGEEAMLWQQIQSNLEDIVPAVNNNTDLMRQILAADGTMAKASTSAERDAGDKKLDDLFRKGVKSSDATSEKLKTTIESLQILSALQKVKEEEEEKKVGSSRSSGLGGGISRGISRTGARENRERDKEKEKEREKDREKESSREKDKKKDEDMQKTSPDLYDFDNMDESAMASPAPSKPGPKISGSAASDRSGNRDSVPPRGDRDTPGVKADSAEPQLPIAGGSSAAQRSKITFVKGQDVIFRPKPQSPNESTEWFLGKVQQVLGEGKSRRYKVKDEDPDLPADQRQEYRTSASSMIPLPPLTQELPDLEKGRTVLALYPDSTTFYKAEVMGTDKEAGKVSLRFEGEENSGTLQVVDRRFVVEYRN